MGVGVCDLTYQALAGKVTPVHKGESLNAIGSAVSSIEIR